jgi:adenylate cyclase
MPKLSIVDSLFFRQKSVPLRWVLIVPFTLQILVAVGLTGYLSLRNSEKSMNEMAVRIEKEASGRVKQHLDSYLVLPPKINQLNQAAIKQGRLNLQDSTQMAQVLCQQMQTFNIGYNGYATPQGLFIGIERLDNGTLLINEQSAATGGKLNVYQSTADCTRSTKTETKTDYQPLEESWYTDATKAQKPIWSSVYNWDDKPEVMSVSASYPMYGPNNQLQGVLSIDLILTQVRDFLQTLKVSPNARTFLMEGDGSLIASSAKEQPFKLVEGKAVRLKATDIKDEVIRSAAAEIKSKVKNLAGVTTDRTLEATIGGTRHFIHVTPWKDELGLNWFVVVAIPDSDFLGGVQENTRQTIVLSVMAVLATLIAGLLTSRWITRPVEQLSEASEALAEGDWQIVPGSRVHELGILANTFNRMSEQLQLSLTALQSNNQSLAGKVSEQSYQLSKMLRDLEKTQKKQVNKQSEYEQLANMIATRISYPINSTQESLQLAHKDLDILLRAIPKYQITAPDGSQSIDIGALLMNLQNQLSTIEQSNQRIREAAATLAIYQSANGSVPADRVGGL